MTALTPHSARSSRYRVISAAEAWTYQLWK